MYNGGVLGGSGTLTAATYALEGGIITANLGAGIANLAVGNTTLNGLLGAASVNITSGSLILGGDNRLASGATVTLGGGALDSGANATTITTLQLNSGVVTGSGLLTATTYNLVTGEVAGALGAGTANVTGAVSLTGTTAATTLNINTGGVLTLGSADRIADATNLVVNGGEFALGTNTETLASVSLLGGKLSGSGTLTGTSYNVESGTVSLVLAGAGVVLTKSNSGTVLLEGTNIFTGGIVLNAGTLVLGNAGALNAIAPNTVAFGAGSTAKLQLNGYSVTLDSLATNTVAGSPVVENASASAVSLTINGASTTIFAGLLQDGTGGGALSLNLNGSGDLALVGNNTFSGGVTLSSGTLRAGSNSALGDGTLTFSGGRLSSDSVTARTLSNVLSLTGSLTQ